VELKKGSHNQSIGSSGEDWKMNESLIKLSSMDEEERRKMSKLRLLSISLK